MSHCLFTPAEGVCEKKKILAPNQATSSSIAMTTEAQKAVTLVGKDHTDSTISKSLNGLTNEGEVTLKETEETTFVQTQLISPQPKKIQSNELSENKDFISFDFSSDEESDHHAEQVLEQDGRIADYDAYQSADEEGVALDDKPIQQYPWIKNRDHSKQLELSDWLTLEIKDFINYISPSIAEIEARNNAVKRLRKEITTNLWSDCYVNVFGSFATDLYLPGSDIDMVITSDSGKYCAKSYLYQLSSFLRSKNLGVNIETIARAKVPIIKFIEPRSKIHIDVSFEKTNGLRAAERIQGWLKETPGLRELVLIVKQFLAVRRMNNVHHGGLGGFSIICLVHSFLSLHPRLITNSIDPLDNLGVLLIEFFELYGYNFGYDNVILSYNPAVCYLKKEEHSYLGASNTFALAIQDPDDPSNNISRSSYNIRNIKRSFIGAFELLTNKCYELQAASYKERLGQSILGGIIRYTGKERDFEDARDKIINEAYVSVSRSETPQETYTTGDLPPLPSEVNKSKGKKRKRDRPTLEEEYADITVESSDSDITNVVMPPVRKRRKSAKKTKIPKAQSTGVKADIFMSLDDPEDDDHQETVEKSDNNSKTMDDEADVKERPDSRSKSKVSRDSRNRYWLDKAGF
ncbi:BA75_03077T0 [Komagataella pastoris]|uniref:polynucleotide adenylyltransferase n=1 Tax=Komagataella pastoris TaxID=4922 RepID=A0A1B2JCE4_PICPA|nr:BA75_03077T0 [Komagataella pastoris]